MATKFNSEKVLFNKLNHYFKDKVRMSLIFSPFLIIITKEDLFYCINIDNENIPSFIINDDKQVIQDMIAKDLCHKQINDLFIGIDFKCRYYCFARNEYNIYLYYIFDGVMREYISRELITNMCWDQKHSILLTQSGKVYEYEVYKDDLEKSEKYIHFKLKSFNSSSFQNDKIKMISCGKWHSLALTESGLVFSWGDNDWGQLGIDVRHSSEPIIIELNDLKIQKISCGEHHSLLLSCDGHIYAFGGNGWGEVGNGTLEGQRFPIKLELNNKFIDIASHPCSYISMSQSIDGIYYVWGWFKGKSVLKPQLTKYESFEDILRADHIFSNTKKFDKLVEFEDKLVKNGFYSKHFQEINQLGSGSFGSVYKVKGWGEYSAIKRIKFTSVVGNEEIIREYLNYNILRRNCFNNEYLVKHFDAWFEKSVVTKPSRISLFIQMELCDKTLDDLIEKFDRDSHLKTNGMLTPVGYYIASQIFIQIHRDLKPANILVKQDKAKGLCIKIADFGLIAIHKYFGQSHTSDKGTLKYMAPEAEHKEYDTKADIYSLGVIFKELTDCDIDE
jgi:hypothetical protein